MEPSSESRAAGMIVALTAVALAWAVLQLWGLGRTPFHTRGEPREAVVVQDLVAHQHWILPRRNGTQLPRKPPLFYWLGGAAALALGEGRTPEGVRLAEAGVAAHLGRPTALVDVNDGPAAIAVGIEVVVDWLGCGLVVLLDVGGDVLATGAEPGLSSPLCDALLLAAAAHLPDLIATVGCAFGAGCDGELTVAEVLGRVAALAREEVWTGTVSPGPDSAREVVAVAAEVPTEASLLAARCALGETGPAPIRGGRRTVELGPVGALGFAFDARRAIGPAAPLAALIAGASSIEEARAAMEAEGIRTELDYERERVGGRPA